MNQSQIEPSLKSFLEGFKGFRRSTEGNRSECSIRVSRKQLWLIAYRAKEITGAADGGRVSRIVRPRRETPKWLLLGKLLDEIHSQADNEAIYHGFVHGKTQRLDAALERIQKAATEARAILRPNANVDAPAHD